jgi:hypothetical protein
MYMFLNRLTYVGFTLDRFVQGLDRFGKVWVLVDLGKQSLGYVALYIGLGEGWGLQ